MNTVKLTTKVSAPPKDKMYFKSEVEHFCVMVHENAGQLASKDLEKRYVNFLGDVLQGKAQNKSYGVDVLEVFIDDLENRHDIDIEHSDVPKWIRGAELLKRIATEVRKTVNNNKV